MKIHRKTNRFAALFATVPLLAGPAAQAASVTILEPSFEGAAVTYVDWGFFSYGPLPSPWVVDGDFGAQTNTDTNDFYTVGPPQGDIFVYANGEGYISQTLTTVLFPDTVYTLTVGVGYRKDMPGAGFPGYGIELWAGGSMLASDYDVGHDGTGAATPAADEWKDAVVTYTSLPSVEPGQYLEIRLIGYGIQTNYDHVRLDASPIPEPSALAFAPLAVLGFAVRRRRAR